MEAPESLANITPDATIEQIVAANEKAGELLASIGLPVTEHEDETLRSVCQQKQWSEAEVLSWVKKHSRNSREGSEADTARPDSSENSDLTEWTRYLRDNFVSANRKLLEELNESFPRVLKIHGNQYPWLKEARWHIKNFREALEMYYAFEEKKFFPVIEEISGNNAGKINHGSVQKLEKSFSIIEDDQDRMKEQMSIIRENCNEFENPAGACSTFRIQNKNFVTLFSRLRNQFEVENNHLIPGIKKELKAKR